MLDLSFCKVLVQSCDLANLLEEQYLAGSITINAYAGAGVRMPWHVCIEGETHRRWQWCCMAVGCVWWRCGCVYAMAREHQGRDA